MPRDRRAYRHAPFSQKTAPLDHDGRGGRWPVEVARLEVSTKACSNAAGGSDGRSLSHTYQPYYAASFVNLFWALGGTTMTADGMAGGGGNVKNEGPQLAEPIAV